jgi:hypothetical protein
MVLAEQDDESAVAERRYFSVESMAKIGQEEGGESPAALLPSDRVEVGMTMVKLHHLTGHDQPLDARRGGAVLYPSDHRGTYRTP